MDRSRVFQQSGKERVHTRTQNFQIKKEKRTDKRFFLKNFLHNQQNLNCKMILVSFLCCFISLALVPADEWLQWKGGARVNTSKHENYVRDYIHFSFLLFSLLVLNYTNKILIVLSLTLVSGVDNFQTQYKFLWYKQKLGKGGGRKVDDGEIFFFLTRGTVLSDIVHDGKWGWSGTFSRRRTRGDGWKFGRGWRVSWSVHVDIAGAHNTHMDATFTTKSFP